MNMTDTTTDASCTDLGTCTELSSACNEMLKGYQDLLDADKNSSIWFLLLGIIFMIQGIYDMIKNGQAKEGKHTFCMGSWVFGCGVFIVIACAMNIASNADQDLIDDCKDSLLQ